MTTTPAKTKIKLRSGRAGDAAELGRICYEAFKTIAEHHNFPPDFPSADVGAGLMAMMLSRPDVYSVVAETAEGRVLGSNFLWESDSVSGVGPITVDPAEQNASVGRALMADVMRRAESTGAVAIRLVQAAYHNRSLSLYTKLGFDTVEPLSLIQGASTVKQIENRNVRSMSAADLDSADELAVRIHGHTRYRETSFAVEQGTAAVVEQAGRITGYTTGIGFFGHAVAETNEDLAALIAAADGIAGPGFLLPTRNSDLMRWCLNAGLRVVQPMTLMSRGFYQEPQGAFLPSILF